jgi:hypothetical protein
MSNEVRLPLSERRPNERGVSLLETVIALLILLTVSLGLMPLGLMAISKTESEGHLVARVTEYSQDKMEQLLSLAYGDASTDTRVFPAALTGGTGLAPGGSADPAAPVALYVDYLNSTGDLIPATGTAAPSGWFYKRVWRVALPMSATGIKQVTVTTISARRIGAFGIIPRATLVSLKTIPF